MPHHRLALGTTTITTTTTTPPALGTTTATAAASPCYPRSRPMARDDKDKRRDRDRRRPVPPGGPSLLAAQPPTVTVSPPPRHVYRWDLDKTYLKTDFDTLRDLVRSAFERAEAKRAVPGAAALLRELRQEQVEVRAFEHTPLVEVFACTDVARGTSLFDTVIVFNDKDNDTRLKAFGGAWTARDCSGVCLSRPWWPMKSRIEPPLISLSSAWTTSRPSSAISRSITASE